MTHDRGQTTQDYILGVSIMLATVLFVFGFLPGVFQSYSSAVDGTDRAQAERAAEYIMSEFNVLGEENILQADELYDGLKPANFETFRRGAGLNTQTNQQAKPNINVMVVSTDEFLQEDDRREPLSVGGKTYDFGDDYDNQSAATRTRVIMFDDDPGNKCKPSCYLIVRVW